MTGVAILGLIQGHLIDVRGNLNETNGLSLGIYHMLFSL